MGGYITWGIHNKDGIHNKVGDILHGEIYDMDQILHGGYII